MIMLTRGFFMILWIGNKYIVNRLRIETFKRLIYYPAVLRGSIQPQNSFATLFGFATEFHLYRTALETCPTGRRVFNFFVSLELKVSRSRRYNSIIQKNFISIVFLAVELYIYYNLIDFYRLIICIQYLQLHRYFHTYDK